MSTFADRLNDEFDKVFKQTKVRLTNRQVSEDLARDFDVHISHKYLSKLRSNTHGNLPAIPVARALASYFGVSLDVLVGGTVPEFSDEDLATMRDAGVRQIAMRYNDLSPPSQEAVLKLVEQLRQKEGHGEESSEGGGSALPWRLPTALWK